MQDIEKKVDEDGSICVRDKKIIVKNPIGNGDYPIITPPLKGDLIINGEVINRPLKIKEKDKIEFIEFKVPSKRNIDISWNKEKIEGYISINYEKEIIYSLVDSTKSISLILEVVEKEGEYPPIISKKELEQEFNRAKINYGILDDVIKEIISSRDIKNLLFAKGILPKPPLEDSIKIFFNSIRKSINAEDDEKIDYRNFNSITSVKANEVLAEIIKGEDGVNGINIFSQIIPSKKKKESNFIAGNGAKLKDNIITSTIDGKPNFNKNTVLVEPIYILNKDVTITTGNINFPANVEINGKVTEGMKVVSGGSLVIRGGLFSADIDAKNSSDIIGNIVNSNIKIGGTNLIKSERISILKSLREDLYSLLININYLSENNLIDKNIAVGYIIKSLIETKFRNLSKTLIKVISCTAKDGCSNSEVLKLVKTKLIGNGPSSIKDIREIEAIIYRIDDELSDLEKDVIMEANLNIEYAQESKIDVVGNINISGKGLFTSELNATKSIMFTSEKAICRGGHLKAGEMIKASAVGSESGVITNLEVDKKGEIYVDLAYHNTTFIIGNKKYILDKPSKNIHIYIDKDSSLAVDKLLL